MSYISKCDKIILLFILVLSIVAVNIWTIFLIQMQQLMNESDTIQNEHIQGAKELRQNTIDAKENSHQNMQMTKINTYNIQNILNNISEIKQKLNNNNSSIR